MSVKKNLTVATLATLLAVPALGTVHNNAHAANLSLEQDITPWEEKTGTGNWVAHPKNGFHNNPNGGRPLANYSTTNFKKGGHTYTVEANSDTKGTIIGMDGNNNVSNSQILASLAGKPYAVQGGASSITNKDPYTQGTGTPDAETGFPGQSVPHATNKDPYTQENDKPNAETGTPAEVIHTGKSTDTTGKPSSVTNRHSYTQSNIQSQGTNTQYSSKNTLPQTGESNSNSKAMAMSVATLGASASLMALAISKKHKQEANLNTVTSVKPAVNNGNDKKDESDSGKTVYNAIMSDTFQSISKGLNNL